MLNVRILLSVILISGLILLIEPDSSYSQSIDIVKVETVNVEEVNKIISDRSGKPLLINVWATWCVPCREEFPDLVNLAEKYKSKIDFIGFTVDLKKEKDSKVIPFLIEYQVNFPNFIVDVKDPEGFINLLNEEWNGAIPATFIYDKNGNQIENIIGKSDYNGFEKTILKVTK